MNKIRSIAAGLLLSAITIFSLPTSAWADGSISASGGGTKTVGDTFNITVAAKGAEFDTLQGTISVSGPVDIVSFSAGNATWMPGYSPSNGKQFVGMVSATSSFTVATIRLRAKSIGSGSVSVSGAKMVRTTGGVASVVGTGTDGTTFTIQRALVTPGQITVTSSSHPDQSTAYEATTIALAWDKGSGVTDFSYLLDQAADTTPPTTATSADTSISYPDKAIGEYYFHIRAKNGDGWGPTTTFKITIKEPDAKIDETLTKPTISSIEKTADFSNNIAEGNISGIKIKGKTIAGYTANIILAPSVSVPEGKSLSAMADANGDFELLIDYPINSGFYKLTVQGQLNKVLTPVSDPTIFEISQAKGGKITLLTSADEKEPIIPVKKWWEKINYMNLSIGLAALFFIALGFSLYLLVKNRSMSKVWKGVAEKMNLK
ncbi:MAG: hypothetical protein WCG48_01540 [Candidatus Berkelbacteria bacterium]